MFYKPEEYFQSCQIIGCLLEFNLAAIASKISFKVKRKGLFDENILNVPYLIWELKMPISTVVKGDGRRMWASQVLLALNVMAKRGDYLSLRTTPSASGGAIESWNGVLK